MRLNVKAGFGEIESNNIADEYEMETEEFVLENVVKAALVKQFGNVEEVVNFWKEYTNGEVEDFDSAITYVLNNNITKTREEEWKIDLRNPVNLLTESPLKSNTIIKVIQS
jgi:hypothetical protein